MQKPPIAPGPRTRWQSSRVVRPVVQLVIALFVAGAIFIVAMSVGISWDSRGSEDWIPFDRRVWIEHAESGETRNPRRLMVPDLQERLESTPIQKDAVLKFLGPPTFERGGSLYYTIGSWGNIDPSSFAVDFDAQGRIARMRLVEH